MNNLIIKGSIDTINKEERIFSGWGSIQIIDRQGDFINIDEFKPVIQRLLAMGHKIPIQDSHSNHNCGEIIKIEFLNTTEGQPGIYLTSKIYSRFPSDDDIWNAIKSGEYSGYSLGGKAGNKTPVCDQNGCYNLLTDIEIWEFSIVSTPANPGALITQVNKLAKGLKVQKARVYVKYPADAPQGSGKALIKAIPITKYVHQCGDKFCVYSEAGKKLGTHPTKDDANKQLYAIEINKYVTYRGGLLIDHDTEESVAPDGSRKPLTAKEHVEMVRIEEKLDNKKVQKARVYVKNPSEAPSGLQIHVGPEGGKYYETEELGGKQRQKVEHEQRAPKVDIKPIREVVGEQLYDHSVGYNKEILPLLETYGKIATGKASDNEVNEVAEVIKRRLPNVLVFYEGVVNSDVESAYSTGNVIDAHQKVIDALKDVQNKLNTAKDRKDKIIAIDNFMQTAHTSGDNVVRRLWNRPSYTGDVASKYLQYLRETTGKKETETPKVTSQPAKHIEIIDVDPSEFEAVKSHVPEGLKPFLSSYTPAEMKSMGVKTFLTKNKLAGAALNGDEIINVFSLSAGEGKKALLEAITRGGRRLDCFDKLPGQDHGLPEYYAKFGFKEVRREKNWTPGGPDVVYMSL